MESSLIQIIHGSILGVDVDAIVNAANSYGIMGGGVAGVIKRAAGPEVQDEAMKKAPIPVGEAVLTTAGKIKTRFNGIIHAPTMPEPSIRIPAANVGLATRAALRLAETQRFTSIALPGMGTGVGGVTHEVAAAQMIAEIRAHQAQSLRSIILVDVDPAMVQAWRDSLRDSTMANE